MSDFDKKIRFLVTVIENWVVAPDYVHMKGKCLILCGPNSKFKFQSQINVSDVDIYIIMVD